MTETFQDTVNSQVFVSMANITQDDTEGMYTKLCFDTGRKHRGQCSWTNENLKDHMFTVLEEHSEILRSYHSRLKGTMNAIVVFPEWPDDLVYMERYSTDQARFYITSQEYKDFTPFYDYMKELFPQKEPSPEEISAEINFWCLGSNGPSNTKRWIDVATWEDIRGNYATNVLETLDPMMVEPNKDTGKMMLWRGPAGTGKTWALRALAWEWRKWAKIYYITDPEVFFGQSAYMISVLMGDESSDKWKILVLEDAGELLTVDSVSKTGKSFGRLLNIVDGLIGQGLKIMTLVTTNEEIKSIHPAVLRPGRCLANIEFGELNCQDANRWLKEHGSKEEAVDGMTLAQLYATMGGVDMSEKKRKVGFV